MKNEEVNDIINEKKKTRKHKKKKKRKQSGSNSTHTDGDTDEDNNNSEKDKKEIKNLYGERFEKISTRLLGKGSFGEIYLAKDVNLKQFCAIKLENTKNKAGHLKLEKTILDSMHGAEGFTQLYGFGSHNEINFLAMDLLGPNLEDLFDYCNYHFSLQTVLLIGIQIITRLQDLHLRGYIHRDIKPENFSVGIENKANLIYLIDFGLSKRYRDNKNEHIPYREKRPLTGTARYASINNHMGIEQSRRDDLEAVGYLLLYFTKKNLPWQGAQGSTKQEKYNKILDKKLSLPIEVICKDLPSITYVYLLLVEFCIYLNYVRNLKYNEKPDYNYLKGLFTHLLFTYYLEKFYFDWTLNKPLNTPINVRTIIY